MPQMNPIYWTSLFITFVIILILTNSINYFFNLKYSFKIINNHKNLKTYPWKW